MVCAKLQFGYRCRVSVPISRPDVGQLLGSIEPSPIATVITNPRLADNPIVAVNAAFERLTGFSPAEAIGRNCRFLAGPESGWVTGNAIPIDGGHHLRRGPDYGGISRFLYGDASTEPGYTGA